MKLYDLLCIGPTDEETRVILHDRYYKTIKKAQFRNPIFVDLSVQNPDLQEYLDDEICEWYLDKSDQGDPELHIVFPYSLREHQILEDAYRLN